jgi:DNA-binding transcriptional ArsR family regulator
MQPRISPEDDRSLFTLFCIQISMYRVDMQTLPVAHTDALARFGHALSDATRTRILLSLRTGPAYPSEMAEQIGVSRQILSNHLACLRGCGLVVAVPEGRRSRYELADRRIAAALEDLLGLVLAVDPACCPAAETKDCC